MKEGEVGYEEGGGGDVRKGEVGCEEGGGGM